MEAYRRLTGKFFLKEVEQHLGSYKVIVEVQRKSQDPEDLSSSPYFCVWNEATLEDLKTLNLHTDEF